MVAKSFQAMTQIGEPFEMSGTMYVMVQNEKTGTIRKVRWYTEKEYAKLYPKDVIAARPFKSQKDALGFKDGYITIFNTGMDEDNEWFQESNARYCIWWGWYIVSTEKVSCDLPIGTVAVRLDWEIVGSDDGYLKPANEVRQAVDRLLYSDSKSVHQGTVGERIEIDVVVVKAVILENGYGKYTVHTFEDQDGNQYVWSTSARNWEAGTTKRLRGTIKQHQTYKNIQQTVLTRCAEVK